MRARGDSGETLVEIVIAILILGGVIGALMAGLATAAYSSKSHRDLTTADTVMRSFAELTKEAVQDQCVGGQASYAVDIADFPVGFAPTASTDACPTDTDPTPTIELTVVDADGDTTSMVIAVRRP